MQTWNPSTWDEYATHYPQTPTRHVLLKENAGLDVTEEFCELWQQAPAALPSKVPCVLVRGLFGRCMPGHFAEARRAAAGAAHVVPIPLADTCAAGAAAVAQTLAGLHDKALVIAHSKGGLDTMQALADKPTLRAKVGALILVQTPHRASAVLAQVFARAHRHGLRPAERVGNALVRVLLRATGQHRGCAELADAAGDVARLRLLGATAGVPVLSIVSWSCTPTAWLDSFHQRLGRIEPGMAHDGQFFVSQQLWPEVETVFLPALDHAQPVVGGGHFPVRKFWRTLMCMGHRRL